MVRKKAKHACRSNKKNVLYIFLIIIFIGMIVYSSIDIVKWYLNNRKNKLVQEEIAQMVTVNENAEKIEDKYIVDFNSLKEKNSDTVAWLKVYGTSIEYAVVKSNNNDYYLHNNFNKEYNVAGWIFADYKNRFDGTDKNIIVYGHNMLSDIMFGTLSNILEEEWYNNEENYNIIFSTESGMSIYRVFSVYKIENEEYYLQTSFINNDSYKEFINTLKSRSIKDFNTEVTENDSILTLSTCANSNKYRIVLHAKKINNDELTINNDTSKINSDESKINNDTSQKN